MNKGEFMSLNRLIANNEKQFCRHNDELIRNAQSFSDNSYFDITSGIECSTLLKRHRIENTGELIDFVQKLPSGCFQEADTIRLRTAGALLDLICLLVSGLIIACVENDCIEDSFQYFAPFAVSIFIALLGFAGLALADIILRKDSHKSKTELSFRAVIIIAVSLAAGAIVWRMHPSASYFNADFFIHIIRIVKYTGFAALSGLLIWTCRLPIIRGFAREKLAGLTAVKALGGLLTAFRMYRFRDEIFALCNHARLIRILCRVEEKKEQKPKAAPPRATLRVPKIQLAPAMPEAVPEKKKEKKEKLPVQKAHQFKELYDARQKQRTVLADTSGMLMSTFVLRHKASCIVWSLIDHGGKPVVFVLSNNTDRNQLAEEIIVSFALFNPPEIIEQTVNDPLHDGLHFAGYENTVSVMNDISRLWKMIRTSKENAARRLKNHAQTADEINCMLFEQNENSEGFIRWQIVHFLQPLMSVRLNDLQASEDGWKYGFLPVLYLSEEEWNKDSDVTDYLRTAKDIAVYRVSGSRITDLNEEEKQ